MTEQHDWQVTFQVSAEEVYDAIMGRDHLATQFELAAGGIRLDSLPRPHLGPPERYWIILYSTITLDPAAAARFGLGPDGGAPPLNGGPPGCDGCQEHAMLSIQIWRTAPGASEAEMRIAPATIQPHRVGRYVDGLPLPAGRLALVLAAFMELLSHWPEQGGPQPWPLGRPDLVVQRVLAARAPELVAVPANGHAAPPLPPAPRRGGRPRYPEDGWAFDQVERLRRPVREVYLEWLERLSPERREALSNPYHAFTQMLYRKRQETQRLAVS